MDKQQEFVPMYQQLWKNDQVTIEEELDYED
jgi:hypothetical protein